MKKALVFCGGGAKGSYEAGVWQYLNERGLKFDIVTGTSIGALNAAMYAQDTFDKDLEVWNTITLDKIMKDAFKYDEKVSLKYSLFKNSLCVIFGDKSIATISEAPSSIA